MPSVNEQRQRDIVGDAFGAHVLEDRKAAALRIVSRALTSFALLEHDGQGAGLEFRRIQDLEIDGSDLDLGTRPPDEVAADKYRDAGFG